MANRLSLSFDILARDRASRELEKPGDAAQRTADKVEHGSRRSANAFGLLGRTLAGSSAGALGPLSDLSEKLEVFNTAVEQGNGSKRGAQLFGLGLAATAAGSFISGLHAKEQAAQQQLAASISASGKSYEDYAGKVEEAVKSGEKFGNQAATTIDALNRLVTTTHSPEEAFHDLSTAIDVAAEKHISLAKAAEIVGLTFNGSTRAGKQFGLQLENAAGAAKALQAAQTRSTTANKTAQDAQKTYNEKLDIWNHTATKTRSEAYALASAHDHLVQAQAKAKAATDRLKVAQEKASAAHDAGARNVAKLAAVVKGQGPAAADTFTGHLKKLGAEIEDTLGQQGAVGKVLTFAGPALAGIGGLAQAGAFSALGKLIGRLGGTGKAFKTLRDAEVLASEEGAAAVVANAAVAEAAMVAEGDTAVAQSSRILGAFGKLGGLGKLGAAGIAAAIGIALDKAAQDDAKKRGGTAGKVEGILGSLDIEGLGRGAKKLADYNLGLVTGDDKKSPAPLKVDPSMFGDNNSGDDKLAMQRQKHDAAVAKALGGTKKVAAKAGKDSGDTFLKAHLAQVSSEQATKAASDAAAKQAQAVIDAISSKFQAAQSRLQSLVSSSLSLRQSVTSALQGGSALTDIFQGQDLNANGAFGQQRNFGRVRDFLQRRVAQERKFVLELRSLMKQGLDPSLVAQIASAGVDGGQRVAEAILSGGKGGVGQVNSLERQISSLANSTGKAVADDHFAKQIAEQRRNTEVLGHELQVANGRLAAIQKNTSGSGGSVAAGLRTTSSLTGV